MSLTLNMVGGASGGSLNPSDALIHVNAPYGSTVTFAKGGVTVKTITPDKAFANVDGETADYYYPVKSANYGTWTVTATLNGKTASDTVSVSAAKQYDVELVYNLYLISDGIIQSGISFPVSIRSGQTCSLTAENGYQRFSLTYSGGRRTDSKIDVSLFGSLKCNVTPGGDLATGSNRHGMYVGLMQEETATGYADMYANLTSKANTLTKVNQTLIVDLTGVTGTYNVAVCIENNSSTAYADVYDLWFE